MGMTLNQFLIALGELPKTYRVHGHAQPCLRLDFDCPSHPTKQCCPLTAVFLHRSGQFYEEVQYLQAAGKLGLTYGVAERIVRAADSKNMPNLQVKMRHILGMRRNNGNDTSELPNQL